MKPYKIGTATAIIPHRDDPFRILVGQGGKHDRPVLPGGKIEKLDFLGCDNLLAAARACLVREIREEITAPVLSTLPLGQAEDPLRDVRIVPYHKIRNAFCAPALPKMDEGAPITAAYGCPDVLFLVTIDESGIKPTEELPELFFLDTRTLRPDDLACGHDIVALLYREMIENKQAALPHEALKDFARTRKNFLLKLKK